MTGELPILESIEDANRRHDAQHGNPYDYQLSRIRCAWNEGRVVQKKPLTDKAIEKYIKAGYYTGEFKEARRELMKRKGKRTGNFEKAEDGRLIYRI